MPATPQEIATLHAAYEQAHDPISRALAELLVVGNVVLESHAQLETPIGDAFETFVLDSLAAAGVEQEDFKAALLGFEKLKAMIGELERLP